MQKIKKIKKIKWLSFAGVLFLLMILPFVWNYMSVNLIKALSYQTEFIKPEIIEIPQKENSSEEQVKNKEGIKEVENVPLISKASISGLGPVESFLIIKDEFSKIRNLNDLILFTKEYGSDDNISRVQQLQAIIDIVGEETIMPIIISAAADRIISTEIISSSEDSVEIKTISERNKEGRVIMVYERGKWRLELKE